MNDAICIVSRPRERRPEWKVLSYLACGHDEDEPQSFPGMGGVLQQWLQHYYENRMYHRSLPCTKDQTVYQDNRHLRVGSRWRAAGFWAVGEMRLNGITRLVCWRDLVYGWKAKYRNFLPFSTGESERPTAPHYYQPQARQEAEKSQRRARKQFEKNFLQRVRPALWEGMLDLECDFAVIYLKYFEFATTTFESVLKNNSQGWRT